MNIPDLNTPALVLRGVGKRYGSIQALDGLDLEVPRGSIFGFVGPNGAGKTTTFAIACGFLRADRGSVSLLGRGAFDPARHRGQVTALPQDAALSRDLTLWEQLMCLGRLQGISRRDIGGEVERILKLVDLTDRAQTLTRTLSHGMLRRLGIGQSFLGNPQLVLLDEPTNGLDPRQAREIRDFIASQRGTRTIIVSSHNLHEIETICDHVALIDHGRVVMSGKISQVTGQNEEVGILLAEGAVPIEQVKAALPDGIVVWDASARVLSIRFKRRAGHETEDVIGLALRALLDGGARISGVTRGQSLERAFLELPTGATPPGATDILPPVINPPGGNPSSN